MGRARELIARFERVIRYYGAGVVNTAFGYGLFALMLKAGLNLYVAQLAAHVLGVAFNYLTYSRHVFRDAAPAKLRFVLSYAFNYLMGLGALASVALVVTSPYVAGLIAVVIVSFVNYFILKHLIFRRKSA